MSSVKISDNADFNKSFRVYLAKAAPVLESVEPIVLFQKTKVTFIIRGRNLSELTAIDIHPANNGLHLGNKITVNATGTEASVDLYIDANATKGAHFISVTTLGGVSDNNASAYNTFTIH